MFIVAVRGRGDKHVDRKAFEKLPDAKAYVSSQMADGADQAVIFEVPDTNDADVAYAALIMGRAHLVEFKRARNPDAAYEQRRKEAYERARLGGADALFEFFKETL